MALDVLVLNSGNWVLTDELPALPWHVLIYSQRGAPGNELHVWLLRDGSRGAGDFAFKRFWSDIGARWCVEVPPRSHTGDGPRIRFSTPDGKVFWAEKPSGRGLGDLSDEELSRLLSRSSTGPYSAH